MIRRTLAGALALLAVLFAAVPAAAQAGGGRPAADAAARQNPPAASARIAITAGFAALDASIDCREDKAERLYLSVENAGAAAFTVRQVELLSPRDLQFCAASGAVPVDGPEGVSVLPLNNAVPAGSRQVIALRVGTRETPRPGTVPLVLAVEIATAANGREQVDRVIASDRVELRIPGVSDMLRLLGIPTLLFLPGVLVLAALTAARGKWDWEQLSQPSKPIFWVVVISVSAVLSLAYSAVAQRWGYSRDLAERFTLVDVALVWIVSLIIGAILGVIIRVWQAFVQKEEETISSAARAAKTIRREDSPADILAKMTALGAPWPPAWCAHGHKEGFLIEKDIAGAKWLIPQAAVAPAGAQPAQWRQASAALRALLKEKPSLTDLIAALRKDLYKPLLPLVWRGGAPQPIKAEDNPAEQGDRHFIFLE